MKKVFIGVLAALMLFAFTACDQQIPEIPKKDVQVLSAEIIEGDLGYLVGREFDPSRYTVEITFNDLSTTTVGGASILTAESTFGDQPGAQKITVNYGNTTAVNPVYVYAYAAASLSVDASAAATTYEDGKFYPDAIDKDDLVVTVVRTDGVEETLANDEYKVETAPGATATAGVVTVKFGSVSDTYDVTISEAPLDLDPAMTYVNGIKSAEYIGDTLYISDANRTATATTASNWKIVGTTPYGDYTLQAGDASNVKFESRQTLALGENVIAITVTVGTKTYTVYETVTVNNALNGVSLMPGNRVQIKSAAGVDVVLTEADYPMFAGVLMANDPQTGAEIKTGLTVTDISKHFFTADETTANVTVTVTWTGSGDKEYTVTNVPVDIIR